MKDRPKSRKFIKAHLPKLRSKPFIQKAQTSAPTVYVLVAQEPKTISAQQIEAARRVVVRRTRTVRGTKPKLLIRVSPSHPLTETPRETRMGSRKGAVSKWVIVLRNRTILFEISRVADKLAKDLLIRAAHKLSRKYCIEKRTSEGVRKPLWWNWQTRLF